jgi:hypothetical protein
MRPILLSFHHKTSRRDFDGIPGTRNIFGITGGNIIVFHARLREFATVIVPATTHHAALYLLSDILADVSDGAGSISVELNRSRESIVPSGEIVDDLGSVIKPALALARAARFTRLRRAGHPESTTVDCFECVGKEAVEVYSPVLMPFRHDNVCESLPADLIVSPLGKAPYNESILIPIHLSSVQSESYKVLNRRTVREFTHTSASTTSRAENVSGFI